MNSSQGIDDILNYLTNEYINGRLTAQNIQDYVNQLKQTISDKEKNPEFVKEMRSLFNSASRLSDDDFSHGTSSDEKKDI